MSNETRKEIGLDSESFYPLFSRGQMLRNSDGIQFAVTETPHQRNGMLYHFRSYGLDDDHMIHELSKYEMEDGRFISENVKVQPPVAAATTCSLAPEQVFLAFIAGDPDAPHWTRGTYDKRWEQACTVACHIGMLGIEANTKADS